MKQEVENLVGVKVEQFSSAFKSVMNFLFYFNRL